MRNSCIEKLEPVAIGWSVIDYLSIRYIWNEHPAKEEQDFKAIATKKIQDYYGKIKAGLDISEAIKQRCQDKDIEFWPFADHRKIYSETFDKKSCWEQRLQFKVGKDTNPEWGDEWLKEVLKVKKGEISPVITLEKPSRGVGLYFIVKVLDTGGGNTLSIQDLLDELKKQNNIKVYIK